MWILQIVFYFTTVHVTKYEHALIFTIIYVIVNVLFLFLADKTNLILTFAICGFANFSSIAIQLGVTGTLAPTRRKQIAQLGIKAVIAGTLANFLNAAVAGMMFL